MATIHALPNNTRLVNANEVRRALQLLTVPRQVVEIRALEASLDQNNRYTRTYGGYFDNPDDLIKAISAIRFAMGIYITLHPCTPDILHRAKNKLVEQKKDSSTADKNIARLKWFPIDCDPERVSGISSTDEEHEKALAMCRKIREALRALGWPDPILADSGNGFHLLYPIDLPTSDSQLLKRALEGLQQFNENDVHVDQTLFNPSRIIKLYGTLACKGDNTDERPHRFSRILEAPAELQVVSRELIESIAVPAEQTKEPAARVSSNGHKSQGGLLSGLEYMRDFIARHGIETLSEEPYNGGTKIRLARCFSDPSHTDNAAYLYVASDGKLGFKCSHNSCARLEWRDFRLHFESTAYDKRDTWANTTTYSPGQGHSQNGNGHASSPNSQPDLETIIQRLGENEYGDGLLFAEVFNGQVCHDHSEKAWYLWNKHHWKKDVTGKIKRMVSGHLGSIYLKARGDVHKQIVDIQAQIEALQKENKEDEKLPKLKSRLGYLGTLMEELEKRARALRSANRMKNVLTFAMSEHNIGITGEIWDADPWLIGVTNGVVDLRTGECRDGYPIDYIRSVSTTEWTGLNTPCPRFERFLQEIFEVLPEAQLLKLTDGKFHELPKEEQEHIVAGHRKKLIDFLKRLLGYSIAGLSTEAIFPIFYGEEGRNGKDTLFTLLRSVLGTTIANAVHNDVFLSADKGRTAGAATPHLADLQGKRIVWGSETKQGDRINVSQIKHLTGGGAIPARPPYGQLYTFDPTHTLFLMTNYKPHADAKDKAFWSRACLIEFCLRFVDKPQGTNERKADTSLPRELEAEASGILALLVRSCLEYQQQGLNRPEIVELATESYRASEDNIQQFIDECCVLGDNKSVGAKRLYDTYISWCKDNNLNHINGKLFGLDMSKRFVKKDRRAGLEYQKIGIRIDETPPEDLFGGGSEFTGGGSKTHPPHPSEPASEQASDTTEKTNCGGCGGYNQEVPYNSPREDSSTPFYGSTLHTLHTSVEEKSIKQPLEPNDESVEGQDAPSTPEFDPPQVAAIPEDFTYEEKECTQCGCGLMRHLEGSQICVRCYPPKGYHAYSDLIDMIYPKQQQKAEFGKGGR